MSTVQGRAPRLALVFPCWCREFGEYEPVARRAASFPPLNLAIIAGVAQRCGWDVRIVDAEVEGLPDEVVFERLRSFAPDLVGLSATSPFFERICEFASAFKRSFATPIVVGGPHVSILRERAFAPEFDHLAIGETELTLPAFLQAIAAGEPAPRVPGFMTRVDGAVAYGGDGPRVECLDEVPVPVRELLPVRLYRAGTPAGQRLYTSVMMSRGCPFDCVYCANTLHGRKVRRRSVGHVADELENLVKVHGIEHVYFVDDVLTLDRTFILALCDEIEKRRLSFTFEGSTRADLWQEPVVARLRQCGLVRISFGLETADPEVRRLIKKTVPMDAYVEANRLNRRYGVETINSVMLGLPGENRERIEATVRFLCGSRDIHHATYGIAQPYPGTELLEMAVKGEHGLALVQSEVAGPQRYGTAHMSVGGISPEELVHLQRVGLMRIYSCWWRWLPMIRRHGITPLVLTALGVIIALVRHYLGRLAGCPPR